MSTKWIRTATGWADSGQHGFARTASGWAEFGADEAETETITWPDPPSNTDAVDGSQAYNMGMVFHLVAGPRDCSAIEWRVPDTVSTPPGGVHAVSLWNDDTDTRLGYTEFTPTPGVMQAVTLSVLGVPTAVPLVDSVNYLVAVYTVHYVFRSGSPSGFTSPSGNLVAGTGKLAAYNSGASSAPKPVDSFSSTYFVRPIVSTS